jgi:hypothetical protein
MMFGVQLGDRRTRRLILSKIKSVLRRGPAGLWRVLKNAARLLTGRWEQPATADWWQEALRRAGFRDVELQVLEHEGGIAVARRPEGSALPSRRDLAAVAA